MLFQAYLVAMNVFISKGFRVGQKDSLPPEIVPVLKLEFHLPFSVSLSGPSLRGHGDNIRCKNANLHSHDKKQGLDTATKLISCLLVQS